jgi:hypothetical protein
MKGYMMGGACSIHGGCAKRTVLVGKPEVCVYSDIWRISVWTGFKWHRIGSRG